MNEKLRVSLNEESYEMLQRRRSELAETGNKISWSHALNDCMKTLNELTEKHSTLVQQHEDLMRHFHATPAPLSRLSSRTRESVDLNIKEKKSIKKENPPPKRGKHLLPKDFSPPRSIAKEAGIDYEGAMECFADWANSQGKKYTDWTACFRNACRSWLKEKFPHLRRAPIQPHGNTEILRNEDMSDTRPPLDLGSD